MRRRLENNGFTIIELLIATVVFSLVLLILTGAIIQFNRTYYKGTINTKTQETTRTITEDIARNIQFSGVGVVSSGGRICAGDYRYTYQIGPGSAVGPGNHALIRDKITPGSCPAAYNIDSSIELTSKVDAQEMLGTNMWLASFSVTNAGGLSTISIKVAYGSPSDMVDRLKSDGTPGSDGVMDTCKTNRVGGQFCSFSELNTVVSRRLP